MALPRKRLYSIVGVLFALLLGLSGRLETIENAASDAMMVVRGIGKEETSFTAVLLDDKTFQAWPEPTSEWGGHLAELVRALDKAGARTICFDFVMYPSDKPGPRVAAANNALAEAILGCPEKIVLGYRYDSDGRPILPPTEFRLDDAVRLGFMDLPPSPDQILRKGYAKSPDGKNLSLASALGQAQPRHDPFLADALRWNVKSKSAIEFLTNPQSLEGKHVLIGFAAGDGKDLVRLPLIGQVPGVEAHARLASTLASSSAPQEVPAWLILVASCALLALAAYKGNHLWPIASLGVILVAGSVFMLVLGWFVPVGGAVVAVVAASAGWVAGQSQDESLLRQRIERAFAFQVDVKTLDYLVKHPEMTRPGSFKLVEGTVMFLDVRKSTALAAELPPEVFFQKLNALFARIVPQIGAHGGLLVNFTGDGFLAVFGPFSEIENDAVSALAACEAILRARHEHDPFVGIGLHRGSFVLGNLGGQEQAQFAAIGDVVNLAARVESWTKRLGAAALASADVLNFAGRTLGELETIHPENHPEPLQVQVLALADAKPALLSK